MKLCLHFSVDVDKVMLRKALLNRGAAVTTPEAIIWDQGRYMRQGKEYPLYIIPNV